LVWEVSESAAWGVVVAISLFWWLPLPATTRFIDLVSYFLGFLSLIVGLFAFYSTEGEKLQTIDRMLINSSIVDIQWDTKGWSRISRLKLCLSAAQIVWRASITIHRTSTRLFRSRKYRRSSRACYRQTKTYRLPSYRSDGCDS